MRVASRVRLSLWFPRSALSPATFLCVALVTMGVLSGCERRPQQRVPRLTGTFSGAAPDGRLLTISLAQTENTVTGRGKLGEVSLGLSAITAPEGPAVFTMEDGAVRSGHIALSPDGTKVTLRGLGEPMTLDRGGGLVAAASGPFAGQYVARRPMPVRLTLEQDGDLVAGTGIFRGTPVAVTGKVTGPNEARGSVMFSDESRNGVEVTLSEDGRMLQVSGLGGVLELKRR